MKKNMKIYAFIPARGGSKRIPHKNLQKIDGKPLLQYTIEASLNTSLFEKIVVSTDDPQIESLSIELGVDVVRRPSELAKDTSTTIDSVLHFIREHKLKSEDIIILLQPTSPLRKEIHIIESYKLFLSKKGDSLISVTKPDHPPFWNFKLKNGFLFPILDEKYLSMRSQDLPDTYIPNGAIYIASVNTIKCMQSFYSSNTLTYVMSRADSIDIDEMIDLKLAELLIKMNN